MIAPFQVTHVLNAPELSHVTYITGISSVKKPVPYHFAGRTMKNLGLSVSLCFMYCYSEVKRHF